MRSAALLLLLPVAWVACFSNSSGGGGGNPSFDASNDGLEFDSTTPDGEMPESAAEAAADAPVDALVEASPLMDAMADVPAESAPPQTLTVVVGGAAGYESGVNVVFGDSTGAVVASMTTNAAGLAVTALPTATMATVLFGTAAAPQLYTVMGLKLGDIVPVVDMSSLSAFGNPIVNVTAVPASPVFDGGIATYSMRSGGCQAATATLPLSMGLAGGTPPCIGLGKVGGLPAAVFPALVEADDPTGSILGFAFSKINGISMPDDAGLSDVALGGMWSTSTTAQTVSVTNPDGGSFPQLNYSEIADGVVTPLSPAYMMTNVYDTHVGYADAVQSEVSYITSGYSMKTAVLTGAPPTTSGTVDVDATSLATEPALSNGQVDGTVAARPTVTWTGNLSTVTGAIAMFAFNGFSADSGSQSGTWTIVSPGTAATSLQAPALPAALGGYAPISGNFYLYEIYAVDGQTALPS